MKKTPLGPALPTPSFLSAVKENLEQIMGHKKDGRIETLEDTASTADMIAKINEIITRLQQ